MRLTRLPSLLIVVLIGDDRALLHEYAAEFFGVMILVIFGCGVNCQAVLSSNTNASASPKGVSTGATYVLPHTHIPQDFGSVTISWGVGASSITCTLSRARR